MWQLSKVVEFLQPICPRTFSCDFHFYLSPFHLQLFVFLCVCHSERTVSRSCSDQLWTNFRTNTLPLADSIKQTFLLFSYKPKTRSTKINQSLPQLYQNIRFDQTHNTLLLTDKQRTLRGIICKRFHPVSGSRQSVGLLFLFLLNAVLSACRRAPTSMTVVLVWLSALSLSSTTPPPSSWSTIHGPSTHTELSAWKNVHVSPTACTH